VITTPARRLRDALEPIAQQGTGRPARQRWKALGLGGIEGYVWGRAAALGEPAAGVVVAAFGVFEPTSLAATYESARGKASRDAVLAGREAGAIESLAGILGPTSEVNWVGDALLEATAGLDRTARPLFAGLMDVPVPADPHGRLWRAADLVREHRGDSHLAACIAAGLDVVEMNVLTELWIGYPPGEYASTRRHPPEAIDAAMTTLAARGWLDGSALSAAGRDARDGIEGATDAAQDRLLENLGDDTERVIQAASAMADEVIAAGAFTDDPRKRAAG
jgi:hypothetical protein